MTFAPADSTITCRTPILRFRAPSRSGSRGLDSGTLRAVHERLTADAHSVLKPQAYHPRLGRSEAEQLVEACRFGQTKRGSFTMTLACPLHAVPNKGNSGPFTRQVTGSLMQTLGQIATAAAAVLNGVYSAVSIGNGGSAITVAGASGAVITITAPVVGIGECRDYSPATNVVFRIVTPGVAPS